MDETQFSGIKAAGDWELDVLGVPFGGHDNGTDSDGQFFSANTEVYADQFPSPPVVYYHGYEPDGRPSGEPHIIGKVTKIENDELTLTFQDYETLKMMVNDHLLASMKSSKTTYDKITHPLDLKWKNLLEKMNAFQEKQDALKMKFSFALGTKNG